MDGMHPLFLKELSNQLAKPLNIIFNKSKHERRVPDDWKKARISAIYKKGNKTLASNYRPVSLTSVICKVMEKLVTELLINYFNNNKFFTKKQYGFIAGRSTSLQLLRVLEEWTEAVDNGKGVDCIYMDYQKAFDTVPHKRLINKLKAYKIENNMIDWIENYHRKRSSTSLSGLHEVFDIYTDASTNFALASLFLTFSMTFLIRSEPTLSLLELLLVPSFLLEVDMI